MFAIRHYYVCRPVRNLSNPTKKVVKLNVIVFRGEYLSKKPVSILKLFVKLLHWKELAQLLDLLL